MLLGQAVFQGCNYTRLIFGQICSNLFILGYVNKVVPDFFWSGLSNVFDCLQLLDHFWPHLISLIVSYQVRFCGLCCVLSSVGRCSVSVQFG